MNGQQLTELRRSGAAGLHVKWSRNRANTERAAIDEELNDLEEEEDA